MSDDDDRHAGVNAWLVIGVVGAVLVALVVAVIVLRHRQPAVLFLGDSITEAAAPTFRGHLVDDYAVHVDGRGGYRVAEMMPSADNASRFPFEQVVINLGTNDVLGGDQDLDASLQSMGEMIGRFPGAECVHLVTVSEHMLSMTADSQSRAREFNAGLRRLADEDERVHIIEWSDLVADHEREHPDVDLTTDTIHPTARGNELLLGLYRDALDDCG